MIKAPFFLVLLTVSASALPALGICHGGKCVSGSTNAQFYNLGTNAQFIPRGANFIRLNGSIGTGGADTHPVYHSTFSPKFYAGNSTATAAALDDLSSKGYNILRVFIDTGGWTRTDGMNGDSKTEPLSQDYLKNVANFISMASAKNIYVTPTLDGLPNNAYFNHLCNTRLFGYPNRMYLDEGCVKAKAEYTRLFLSGIKSIIGQAGLNGIAWVSLDNEATYTTSSKPFSAKSGVIQTADGGSYDMANATQRQQAADSNALNWAKQSAAVTQSFGVLVGVGMFTFDAVGKPGPLGLPLDSVGDKRFPFRPASLASPASALDMLDVHVYQVPGWKGIVADLATSEWPKVSFLTKPIVMGEFGAWRENPSMWANGTVAAAAMVQQTVDACAQNMTGSMFWTYDTMEQPRLWNFKSAPEIGDALSPKRRPDSCKL